MRSALAYTPGTSPLHAASAGASIAFLGSFVLVSMVFSSPLVLAGAGAAIVIAGLLAGARRALSAVARYGAVLVALIVAVNALVTDLGQTVLVRGWKVPVLGHLDVTLESLVAGGALGLRLLVVLAAFAVYSACVDPDAVMRLLRPVARRSALTATLVGRLVPVAAADLARLREAAALRGPAAAPVSRSALIRRVVAGSLDRSVDVAATLELRGYSLERPLRRRPGPGSLEDRRLYGCALAVVTISVAGLIASAGGFETYPRLALDLGIEAIALSLALPLIAAVGARRG